MWFAALVALILLVLGVAVLFGSLWGLRKAADQELTSGIDVTPQSGCSSGGYRACAGERWRLTIFQ
jgi:hypothetical protein